MVGRRSRQLEDVHLGEDRVVVLCREPEVEVPDHFAPARHPHQGAAVAAVAVAPGVAAAHQGGAGGAHGFLRGIAEQGLRAVVPGHDVVVAVC